MKINILLLLLPAILIVSCRKSSDTPINPKKFEVIDVKCNSSKIIIGQRTIFTAMLSDSTGNINYQWKLFFNNQQVGTTYSGLDIPKVKTNLAEIGEYTVQLTITRGESDKNTLEKKFTSNDSNFQYGIWGDSQTTIQTAETDNGNEIFNALIGIPKVIPNNEGLTTLTYKKSSKYFTYYFKDGKLYAGAFTLSWNYVNQSTNLSSAYTAFSTEKGNLDKVLNTTLTLLKIWHISESSQITYWDTDASTRANAIGLGYLDLKSEGTTSFGRGSVYLYKVTSSMVLLEYILVSP